MLTIRLSRVGKKNKPTYRLIISEKSRDLYGRALEILGSYNPHTKELMAKGERIKYWLNCGASMSPTVNNLLVGKNIIAGQKVKASKAGKKKKAVQPTQPAADAKQQIVTEPDKKQPEKIEKTTQDP